jgi:hypothetical protein
VRRAKSFLEEYRIIEIFLSLRFEKRAFGEALFQKIHKIWLCQIFISFRIAGVLQSNLDIKIRTAEN